jgi:hypothetical protein
MVLKTYIIYRRTNLGHFDTEFPKCLLDIVKLLCLVDICASDISLCYPRFSLHNLVIALWLRHLQFQPNTVLLHPRLFPSTN